MGKRQSWFDFRQFRVQHNERVMKVGTDSVLLGAWTKVEDANRILDIGTGSGVIAMMLAQRTSPGTTIHAIDIQEDCFQLAMKNVESSPWPGKICVSKSSLQDFNPKIKFDLIVSNPPFFNNGLHPQDRTRTLSRHTVTMQHEVLFQNAARLLMDTGIVSLVLPASEWQTLQSSAEQASLYPLRVCSLRTKKHRPISRILVEFGYEKQGAVHDNLILLESGGRRSRDYIKLTEDFYLAT